MSSSAQGQLQEIAEKYLHKIYDYILRFGKRDGTVFKIFYSKLKEEIDRDCCPKYAINTNNRKHIERVEYNEQEYVRL